MKVFNFGTEFELTHDGNDVFVPSGLSGDFSNEVGYHIQFIADKWRKKVRLILNGEEEKKVLEETSSKKPVEQKSAEIKTK